MDDLWTLVRFTHLLGVTVWVGGIIVLGAVVVPTARMIGDRAESRRTIINAARRFGMVGGLAWVVIGITGFWLLEHRGLALTDLPDSDYGRRVMIKMALLLSMGVVAALHGLWQGPRVHRAEAAGDPAAARRWRLLGAGFDAFLLLASLVCLWLAASLIG